jgi:hypothetical protein
MTRFSAWVTAAGACVVIWHECAENPAIFCYRIGRRAFTGIRSRSFFGACNDPGHEASHEARH